MPRNSVDASRRRDGGAAGVWSRWVWRWPDLRRGQPRHPAGRGWWGRHRWGGATATERRSGPGARAAAPGANSAAGAGGAPGAAVCASATQTDADTLQTKYKQELINDNHFKKFSNL